MDHQGRVEASQVEHLHARPVLAIRRGRGDMLQRSVKSNTPTHTRKTRFAHWQETNLAGQTGSPHLTGIRLTGLSKAQ